MALVIILAALLAAASAAPAPSSSTTAAPAAPAAPPLPEITPLQPGEEFYDQRQNGSENYRIHMDGMVVVVAPPEALLSISGVANGNGQGGALEQQLMDIVAAQQAAGTEDNDNRPGKPGAQRPPSTTPCVEGSPGCKKRRPSLPAKSRSQLRLANLLIPLLRRQQLKK